MQLNINIQFCTNSADLVRNIFHKFSNESFYTVKAKHAAATAGVKSSLIKLANVQYIANTVQLNPLTTADQNSIIPTDICTCMS